MLRTIQVRLLLAVPTLILVSIGIFVMIRLIPGDPATARLGMEASEEGVAAIRAEMGLDRPLLIQYGVWVRDALSGDFGTSWRSGQSAGGLIASRFPATVVLMVSAMTVALTIALPVGVWSARRPNSIGDYIATGSALVGISVPSFWLAILLVLLFSTNLRWLPPSGFVPPGEDLGAFASRLLMPAFALGFALAGPLTRFVRSGMLDSLDEHFVRTARSKGLRERTVVYVHAFRSAMLSVLTVMGLQVSVLVGGTVVIESVFGWPGIGLLLLNAVQQRDYGIVQGVVLFVAVLVLLINLVIDLLYSILDPRIRRS